MLDTDICSYLVKRKFQDLQARFHALPREQCVVSAITYAELLEGLKGLPSSHPLHVKTSTFFVRTVILPWPAEAANALAGLTLQTRRQPLEDMDLLIAAHAITLGLTLISNNTRHFSRISPPLKLENWLQPAP